MSAGAGDVPMTRPRRRMLAAVVTVTATLVIVAMFARAAAAAGPALAVDASADLHPISPDIYGMNFADESLAAELRLPVRRWGGNGTTRYNWQNDTSNHASD